MKYPDDSEIQIEIQYNVGDGPKFSTAGICGIRFEVSVGGKGVSYPTITFIPE